MVAAASERVRQELVKGLLLGQERNEGETERWSRHLGLDPASEHFVLVLDVPSAQCEAALTGIERYLARNAPGAVVASHSDVVVAIVLRSADGTPPAEQGRKLAQACLAGEGRALVAAAGIGHPCTAVAEIGRSYAEARRARASGIDYLATLSAYFAANSSSARAARGMYLHPNTVSYRIRRAQEFTGLSFSLYRDRLMAEVAVEILLGLDGEACPAS